LTIARKLARRCHHTLRAVGDDSWVEAVAGAGLRAPR
jgi:hypothetical protein